MRVTATAATIPFQPDVAGAIEAVAPAPEGVVVGGGFNGSGGVIRGLFGGGRRQPGAAVQAINHRMALMQAHAQPDPGRFVATAAMVERVVHQRGEHLVQVARVN